MAIEGSYKTAFEALGASCSRDVVAKLPGETRILPIGYERDMSSGETLSSVSGTPSVAPTGGSHITIDASAVSGTDAQLTLSGGVAGQAFTAEADDDTFTSTGHGLSDGDTIHLLEDGAENLPTGVDDETMYYVVSSATNTFKVAKTSGGTAVELSADGQGVAYVDYVLTCAVVTSEGQILTCKAICACRD